MTSRIESAHESGAVTASTQKHAGEVNSLTDESNEDGTQQVKLMKGAREQRRIIFRSDITDFSRQRFR
jgi:hypothetical protein